MPPARVVALLVTLAASAPGCLRIGLTRLPEADAADSGTDRDADAAGDADADGDGDADGDLDRDLDLDPDPDVGDPDTPADTDDPVDADDAEPDGDGTPPGMQLVPAGAFMMGCNADVDRQCDDDEIPYHEVDLVGFFIDTTEVTQAAYGACVDAAGCAAPSEGFDPVATPARPVVHVTWDQARGFCEWAGKRLPTEAEWEKAARGTDGRVYPWGDSVPDCSITNFDLCVGSPVDVGSYPLGVSPYGLLDMAGNAAEWVSDWYASDYYEASPPSNPTGPGSGDGRAIRGSSYFFGRQSIRTSNRIQEAGETENGGRGFRCALSVP